MYDITNDHHSFCELLRICPLCMYCISKTTISCTREKFVENLKMVEDIVEAAEELRTLQSVEPRNASVVLPFVLLGQLVQRSSLTITNDLSSSS